MPGCLQGSVVRGEEQQGEWNEVDDDCGGELIRTSYTPTHPPTPVIVLLFAAALLHVLAWPLLQHKQVFAAAGVHQRAL